MRHLLQAQVETCPPPINPKAHRHRRDKSEPALEKLVIPEGVREIGHQAFGGDSAVEWVDIPSTVTELDSDTFMDDTMLSTLILRSPVVVDVHKMRHSWHEDFPLETCHLIVPERLLSDYRKHTVWGSFRHIEPLPAAKRNAP